MDRTIARDAPGHERPLVASQLTRRPSMGDDVYGVLLAALMDRRIAPGGRISIDGLARELGVSPTPVREALTRLEADGLVTKFVNRGFSAAPVLDDQGLHDLFSMRLLLEPAAAAAASARMDAQSLAELDGIISRMHRFAADAGPHAEEFEGYRDFVSEDAAFHALIAQRSGNPLLAEAVVRLRPHMHLFRLYFVHGIASPADVEHSVILAALRSGDALGAEQSMRDHITMSCERMLGATRPPRRDIGSAWSML